MKNNDLDICRYIHINKLNPHETDWTQFKLIIWDLDGTLYDMGKIKRKIQRASFLNLKVTVGIINFLSVVRKLEKERIKGAFNVPSYQEQFNKLQVFINSFISPDLVLPKAHEVLDIAMVRNINQVVISDFPIADKLERLKLSHYFSEALGCAEEIQCWKPHMNIYQAMEDLLVDHLPFVVIGDRDDTDGKMFSLFIENLREVKFI